MKKNRTVGILVLVFLFMLLLNILLPLRGDDFLYSMIWGSTVHVDSWGTLWESLVSHYLTHGGRMVTVFFLDLFLWMGKLPFDIANAAVFVTVLILLVFHAKRKIALTDEPATLFLAALLMWLCLPHFGEVAVWKSGSTVYLWSGLFVLLFLLPYNLFLAGNLSRKPGAVLMVLAGILGGWSVENFAVTAVLLAFGISWYARKKGNFSAWMGTGALGVFLGFLGLLGAPGNFVRYDEQVHDKGILIHIGNQLAGNGEMVLYSIPVLLLLVLFWWIFKAELFAKNGDFIPAGRAGFTRGQGIMLLCILVMIVSYFAGGFLSDGIRDFLIAYVLEPLHQTKPRTVYHLTHVMEGFEEMAIYWAGVFFLFFKAKKALGFDRKTLKKLGKIPARAVWDAYPAVRFAGFLLALSLMNNIFILAAPTFPARATFSSAMMILAAALALSREPAVKERLAAGAGRVLCVGGFAISLFLAVAAVIISYAITVENDKRIEIIKNHAGSGEIVRLEPIDIKNRALRHVFYKEFELGRDRHYMVSQYYGIKDVELINDNS